MTDAVLLVGLTPNTTNGNMELEWSVAETGHQQFRIPQTIDVQIATWPDVYLTIRQPNKSDRLVTPQDFVTISFDPETTVTINDYERLVLTNDQVAKLRSYRPVDMGAINVPARLMDLARAINDFVDAVPEEYRSEALSRVDEDGDIHISYSRFETDKEVRERVQANKLRAIARGRLNEWQAEFDAIIEGQHEQRN